MRPLAVLSISCLLGALPAQGRVWIVDPANGLGTNFTSLAAAEAAAADGDTLVLRAANYPLLTTAKGISILGTTGVTLAGASGQAAVTVKGLPAGKRFALRGVRLVASDVYTPALLCDSCAGTVQAQDLDTSWYRFEIKGCADVSLARMTMFSLVSYVVPLTITSSLVVVSSASITGANAMMAHLGYVTNGGLAVQCDFSELWLVDSTVTGGTGMLAAAGANAPPFPAITGSGSTLYLRGTSATPISAGAGNNVIPTPAINLGGNKVVADPAVPIVPFGGAQAVLGAPVTKTPLATLLCPAVSLAGTLQPTLRSAAGDAYLIALGVPALPAPSPLGTLFVDLTVWLPLQAGTQPASGATTVPVPVPSNPALRGAQLALQAANGAATNGVVSLTNPVRLVID